MRAVQKIFFTASFRTGEKQTYSVNSQKELISLVSFLKRRHGPGNIRIVPGSVKKSKVLVIGNTIVAKAG